MKEPWEEHPTFAVVLGGRVIGTANLEVHAATRTAMLGYAIGQAWWGQGIGTEAAGAVMFWGIAAFRLVRVWASTDARNVRSLRVMEKLGTLRQAVLVGDRVGRDGALVDEVVYGLKRRVSGGQSAGERPSVETPCRRPTGGRAEILVMNVSLDCSARRWRFHAQNRKPLPVPPSPREIHVQDLRGRSDAIGVPSRLR